MTNILLYSLLCLIWGSTWMAIKLGLQDAPPMWGAALRFVVAVIVLVLYNALTGRRYPQGWQKKLYVAWPGVFTYLGSYSFTYLGSQYIPSALASILFAVFPFLVMLLMPLFIKDEKVTKRAVFGVGLGFAGVVLIFAEPLQLKGEALYGMLLFLLSPVAAAMGTVSIKAFLRDEPVLQMITLQMGLGAFLLCIVAALTEDLGRFEITAVSVGSILYLSICGSIVAFGVYYWLLKRIRLISMSLVALVTPVVAMLIGYLVLGEVLAPLDYVGAALVLTGVAVVNVRFRLPSRLASVVSGNNSTAC